MAKRKKKKVSSIPEVNKEQNFKKSILYIKGPFVKTKHGMFLRYKEQENEKLSNAYTLLKQSENRYLDFQSLYPELRLNSKLVGIFDPISLYNFKLPDFFPFYEVILCRIDLARCSNDDAFRSLYGCNYAHFLELTEIGKVVPLIDANPYLEESTYEYFAPLLQKAPPSSLRYALILQEDYLNEVIQDSDIIDTHTKARFRLWEMLHDVIEKFKVRDPVASKLNILVQKPAQRGDLAQSVIYLDYISSWLESHPAKCEQLIDGLAEVEAWNEQPYIAPGVTLNYADEVSLVLKHEAGRKQDYLLRFLKSVPNSEEESLQKFISFADSSPALSGDKIAVLKKNYFYEPPETYGDPVKYALSISRSDNIETNFKIAKSFQSELERGRFMNAHELLKKNNYEEVIDEINREIKILGKANRFLKVSLQLGANIIGAATGALVGHSLRQGDITLLFSFIGANAASALMKEHSDSIAQRVLAPLFKRSNTSLLLWRHQKNL